MQISFDDPEHVNTYATGGRTRACAFLTGTIEIDKAEIAILSGDVGSVETMEK